MLVENGWFREISDLPKVTGRLNVATEIHPSICFSKSSTSFCYTSATLLLLPKTDAFAEIGKYRTLLWKRFARF